MRIVVPDTVIDLRYATADNFVDVMLWLPTNGPIDHIRESIETLFAEWSPPWPSTMETLNRLEYQKFRQN